MNSMTFRTTVLWAVVPVTLSGWLLMGAVVHHRADAASREMRTRIYPADSNPRWLAVMDNVGRQSDVATKAKWREITQLAQAASSQWDYALIYTREAVRAPLPGESWVLASIAQTVVEQTGPHGSDDSAGPFLDARLATGALHRRRRAIAGGQ